MFAHANCGMCWIVDHTDCGICSLWSMFAVEHVLACTAHGDVYTTAHRRTDLKDMKGRHTQKLILPRGVSLSLPLPSLVHTQHSDIHCRALTKLIRSQAYPCCRCCCFQRHVRKLSLTATQQQINTVGSGSTPKPAYPSPKQLGCSQSMRDLSSTMPHAMAETPRRAALTFLDLKVQQAALCMPGAQNVSLVQESYTNCCSCPQAPWKAIFDSTAPAEQALPDPWDQNLTPVQKLMVLRVLRPDKLVLAVQRFVLQEMGSKFVEAPPFDLDK